jgi:hypothetical protein
VLPRVIAAASAVLALTIVPAATGHAAPSQNDVTVCTWGGTPAAPTGVLTLSPAITNTPSSGPVSFVATGPLGGGAGCSGTLTFRGTLAAGESCLVQTPFQADAGGFPPIHRAVSSYGAGGTAPVRLFDAHGNVIGSEQAQFLTGAINPDDPGYTDCGNPGGLTTAYWSDTLELFTPSG